MALAELPQPSAFVTDYRAVLESAAAGRPLLDLACGRGRHALLAARWGLPVIGLDRDPSALAALRRAARGESLTVATLRADAEDPRGLPLRRASLGAIVVTRFLCRALAPALVEALAPGGVLLYETFTRRQRALGTGPRNPDYLLEEGELPRLFASLEIVESREGLVDERAWLASLVARKPV